MSEKDMDGKRVLIIGAGLAGCSAAISAKNRGHEVSIVESRSKEEIVKNGRTSFEALQNLTSKGDALEYLKGIGIDLKPVYPYKGARIIGPSGNSMDMRLNRLHGYFVRRRGKDSIDHQMIEKVEDLGIKVEFSTRFVRAGRDGRISLKGKGGTKTIRDPIIIGADGLSSAVGRGILPPLRPKDMAVGVGYHFIGDHSFEPGIAQCWLGSRLCPGEYAYVLPSETEVTIVTTMRPHLMEKGSKPLDYLKRFLEIPAIMKGLERTKKLNRVTGGVPVTSGGPLGYGNRLLAGEAARLTDPMLGFGMMNAMVSGQIAGSCVSMDDPLGVYEKEIKTSILKDLNSRSKARNRFLDKLEDEKIDEMITLANKVVSGVDINRFFDKGTRKRAILSAAGMLIRIGGARNFMNLLLPLVSANFSYK